MTQAIAQEIDARGLNCPLPILRIKKAMNAAAKGDTVKMLATDPGSVKDVEAYCRQTGNTLRSSGQESGAFAFLVEKN